jgi:hypothetical protein
MLNKVQIGDECACVSGKGLNHCSLPYCPKHRLTTGYLDNLQRRQVSLERLWERQS